MPEKKNHHYVPQSILRGFSADGRSISLYHMKSRRAICGARIRDQCCRDYFYGNQPDLENAFGTIEGKFCAVLADVAKRNYCDPTFEEKVAIVLFVHYQKVRTASAAETFDDHNEALLKDIAALNPDTADIDPASYQIHFDNTQFLNLKAAGDATLLVADLDVKFIINDRRTGFVISDAAVARYNQFAENHPRFRRWLSYGGTGSKGLQWFYPISPRICVAVFDPTTYSYGGPKTAACRPSSRDVEGLNMLQALYARNCIYYLPGRTSEDDLCRLHRFREKHPNLYDVEIIRSPPRRYPDGKIGQILHPRSPEPHLGFQFNFSRVTDRNPYEGYNRAILPLRNPALFEYVRQENERRDAARKAGEGHASKSTPDAG